MFKWILGVFLVICAVVFLFISQTFGAPGEHNPLVFAQDMGHKLVGIIEQQEHTQRELIGLARDSQAAQNAYLRSQANKQNAEAVALYVVSAAAVAMVIVLFRLMPHVIKKLREDQRALPSGERVRVIGGDKALATLDGRRGVPRVMVYGKMKSRARVK